MAIIVVIKGINLALGYVYQHKTVFLHTIANKITGGLLFLIPLLLTFFKIDYIAIVVGSVATFAAIQEGYFIRTDKLEFHCGIYKIKSNKGRIKKTNFK